MLVEDPFLLAVIDQKLAVGWQLDWLDGTQVGAENPRGRMLVSELNCPYASATSHIEDVLYMFGDRRPIQLTVEAEAEGMMLEIKSVGLGLAQRREQLFCLGRW